MNRSKEGILHTLIKRRDLLAGGVGFGLSELSYALLPKDRSVLVREQDRLRNAGLGDFIGFYEKTTQFYERFDAAPVICDDFYSVCSGVAEGRLGRKSLDVARIRDGWGLKTDKDSITGKAEEKIASILIELTDAKDTDGEVRELLRKIGKILPLNILAMPNQLEIITSSACNGECGGYYIKDTKIAVLSPRKNKENATKGFLHETTHALDGEWEKIKPFIKRKDYLHYVGSYLDHAYNLAASWFSADRDYAGLMVLPGIGKELAGKVEKYEGIFLPGFVSDPNEDINTRFKRVVWAIGSRLIYLDRNNLSQEDIEFLNKKEVRELMRHTLSEIVHSLVGPVGLDVSFKYPEAKGVQSMSLDFEKAIRRLRMGLFSTLPKDATLNDFMAEFGLSREEEVSESARLTPEIDSSKILSEYGAVKLGEYEYLSGRRYRLFELPDNPFAQERKVLYLEFIDRVEGQLIGALISFPKDQYDSSLTARKASFDPSYAEEFRKRGKDSGLEDYSSIITFEIARGREIQLYLGAASYLSTEPFYSEELSHKNIQINTVVSAPNTYEFRFGQVASAEFVRSGDLFPENIIFDQDVLWLNLGHDKTDLFPIPKGESFDSKYVLLFAGYVGNCLLMPLGKEKRVFIPDGSYSLFYPEVGSAGREKLIEKREDGSYYSERLDNLRFTLSPEMDRRVEEILGAMRGTAAGITFRVLNSDAGTSKVQYYLLVDYDQDGKNKRENFPINILKN